MIHTPKGVLDKFNTWYNVSEEHFCKFVSFQMFLEAV